LKSFLDNNEKLLAAIKRYPWYFTFNFNSALKPNTVFLIKEGVPHDRVAKLILMYPRTLQMKPERMVRVVNSVKNLGLEPKAPVFVHALRVMIGMSESTWKRKIEYMKSLGWTEDEVLLTFKRNPDILACSEDKIGRAMDFFVNTVRLGSQTVVANPVLLQYSIDKRVRPRYNVLKVLESKNLIEVNQRVFWLLTTRSEMKFRENYVARYADKVPGLLEIYRGTVEAKKIDT
jgi:mTERF domain-containing protein